MFISNLITHIRNNIIGNILEDENKTIGIFTFDTTAWRFDTTAKTWDET